MRSERSAIPPTTCLDVPLDHVVTSSCERGWNGLDAAEILHPNDDFAVPALARHVLVFNLGAPMVATERRTGRGGQLSDGRAMILPAGQARDWHLERRDEVRHLHLYLAPSLVRAVAAEAELNPDNVELLAAYGVCDPQLDQIAAMLLADLRSDELGTRIHAEALTTVLAVRLLRRHSSLNPSRMRGAARLPSPVLNRALDYIESNLSEDLALEGIARAAGFSPYHFARLFKASTGLSPHQYIIRRRVERARILLTTTNRALPQIASEVGFANGSHLSLHFRRLFGVGPSDYRRDACVTSTIART